MRTVLFIYDVSHIFYITILDKYKNKEDVQMAKNNEKLKDIEEKLLQGVESCLNSDGFNPDRSDKYS